MKIRGICPICEGKIHLIEANSDQCDNQGNPLIAYVTDHHIDDRDGHYCDGSFREPKQRVEAPKEPESFLGWLREFTPETVPVDLIR